MSEKKKILHLNLAYQGRIHFDNFNDIELVDLTSFQNRSNEIPINSFKKSDEAFELGLFYFKTFHDKTLENINIEDFTIDDLPIYWLTDLSVKHPILHWGKNFFVMIALIELHHDEIVQNYKQLVITFCRTTSLDIKEVRHNLKGLLPTLEIECKQEGKNIVKGKVAEYKQLVISYLRNIKAIRRRFQTNGSLGHINSSLYIGNQEGADGVMFFALNELFEKENKKLSLFSFSNKKNSVLRMEFLINKLTAGNYIKLIVRGLLLIIKIQNSNKFKNQIQTASGMDLNLSFMQVELKEVLLNKSNLFLHFLWLKKVFQTIQDELKIFIEDEFYHTGRIVCKAAEVNKKIKTYGLQHGHFNELHTVYSITTKEIEEGIPIPDHFLTWAEYYSKVFLTNNNLNDAYTIPLGNPRYVIQKKTKPSKLSSIKKVLWCLTTIDCTQMEWEIIKEKIKKENIILSIRLHPLNHVQEEEVSSLICGEIAYILNKEKSIEKSINQNDLIIVSAHSTTFIDSMLQRTPCIRILSRFWDGSHLLENKYIKTVSDKSEFSSAFDSIEKGVEVESNFDLVTDSSYWKRFLNNH